MSFQAEIWVQIGRCCNTASSAFAELMRELGIPDAHLHGIRHTVKTAMTRIGISRFIADRVQDHADGSTAARYDHNTYEAEKRDALERWERELLRIVGEKPSNER